MRSLIRIGGFGLLVLVLSAWPPSIQAAKKSSSEEQAAVLLKWSRNYFEKGKYKQAEQAAQLALELAPEDAEILAALKLARRQQAAAATNAEMGLQLEKALQRLTQVERQLRDMEAKNRQRSRVQIAKEPPGSPDAGY